MRIKWFLHVIMTLFLSASAIVAAADPPMIEPPEDITLSSAALTMPKKISSATVSDSSKLVMAPASAVDTGTIHPLMHPMMLSLKEAIFLALRNNPTVENAELDRVTQKYALVVAKNEFEPKYSLTGSFDYRQTKADAAYSHDSSYGLTPKVSIKNHYGTAFSLTSNNPVSGQDYNPSLVFKIEQPLIKGFGKAIVDKTLNDALDAEESNKLALKNTLITTINSVISNYLTLYQAKEMLKVDLSSLDRYEQAVKNDLIRIAAGKMAPTDKVQDQAQVATQRATVQNDRELIETARLTLLNTIGLNSTANVTIPDKVDFEEIIRILTGNNNMPILNVCQRVALANDVSYQTTGIQLRALRRALQKAKDDARWTLNLQASETQGGGSGGGDNSGLRSLVNNRNHQEEVGLDLMIPIDDVSLKQALITARVSLDEAENTHRFAKQTLEADIANTRNVVMSNKEELQLSKSALLLQEKTVDFAKIKFDAGRISNFELLDKQKTLNTSAQSVVNATISYLNALASFNQRLGITLDLLGIKIKDSVKRY